EATVRISPLPRHEEFRPFLFPDFERGVAATRALAQARLPLSMLRLSGPEETRTSFALAGSGAKMRALESWLAARGARGEKCLLLAGATGETREVLAALDGVAEIARGERGIAGPRAIGRRWARDRFRGPYLRN